MPEYVDRIVVFPRYTAFIGTTDLYSAPVDVRAYGEAIFNGWMGTGLGSTPATVQFTVQKSADLETWFDETPFAPASAGAEVTADLSLVYAWMRVKASVSGGDPGVCCWLLAELVRRKVPGMEEAA